MIVDAWLVRMTLTPAIMHLLGERAWRLPRRLDRIIPDVDVEGTGLAGHTGSGAVAGPSPVAPAGTTRAPA